VDRRLNNLARWKVDECPVTDEGRIEGGEGFVAVIGVSGKVIPKQRRLFSEGVSEIAYDHPAGDFGDIGEFLRILAVDEDQKASTRFRERNRLEAFRSCPA